MPSSLKDIYNALREDQQFSQTKDYGTFAKRMNERGYSQMIYNILKTAGASLPDVNTFRKRLGLKDWSAPSTKPVAKSKSQVTPSYADYSATNYNPSSASQGNGVKDKYRYPGLSVPMNSGGTEDTTSSGNESALVRSLRKTDSRKSQPSMRKPIGKVMVENRDEETKNLRGAASEIANEGEKPAYNLGDETTSQYLSKRKSDVAKEHDKVRSVSEAVWDNASKVAGEEFNDYIRERNEMNFTNVVRELAKGASPSRMSEDNWEVGTEAMASHLRNHDLEKLSDAAWNALGESGQKDLINDYYSKILQQYPHADHNEAYEEATKMARAESDNQMYQTAVSKNAPKDVADFFFRKAARTNTVGNIMEANARIKAGTRGDMDARDEADARYEQDHKVAGIGGMVAGFAADPLTAVSGGAGSATAKGAAALAGKAFGQAAVRKFGTTLGGKILTGAAAGMGNLGTLEAGSNVAEQLRQGGWNDDEGKFHEGFSEGQVLKQGLHGAGMGALTGVVSPVIGNVADKAVRATSSTVGKIGIRAGEVGSSILAEGTIFSVPEWMDGKRDKMDVWTDNLAQMAGMKVQGGFKTVANTLAGLHGNAKTGFRERINGILDGNRQDLALTKDERAELEQGGYTDLKQLTDDAVAFKNKKTAPKDGKTVTTTGDGKDVPVNRFEELMADKNISEAARAKMYYYLTGHTLPMSTVTGGSMSTTKDADGKVTGYTVESTGYNGVITRRHFTDRKSADREMDRVHRQAELNNIGIGEHLYDEKTVKVGKPVEEGSAKLRSDIMDEYGIDVNEAFKKSYDKRSEEEQEAIDAYSDRLYDVTRNAESAEDTDPMGLSVAEREGADIVEENHLGTETPQTEAVQSAVTELRQAQTAWAEAMKSDTSLAEGFKAAQEKGIGMVEAYEWMLEQGYGTEESLAPLADVIGASVKVASMWRGTKESIEKTTQDHVSTWQWEGTDFGQGEVTEPTMLYVTDKNGHRLIVKSGHIKFDAKGNAIEGDMIICLDETTGDMVHPSVKDVKFQGTESAKDYADRYRQRLQEINSKGYEALQVTPADAEGKAEDKTAPGETSEPGLPFSDETPKTEPSEASQDIPAEGEPGTPDNGKIEGNYDKDSGIPLDEEGEPLYEQVSKEQTVEDIFGKLDDANLARDYAKHKVSEAEKKLKSVSGKAPKMGTKINEYARKKAEYEAKVKEAQASVDYWKSVVEDIEKLTHTTDEELAEQKRELDGTAAKEEMKDNHEADVPDSGVALAASVLADAKVTPESLKKETGYETKDLNKFVGMLAKKENGGVDLVSLAEKLVEMDEQYNNRFFGGDAQEARNALLEALGQAKTRGELRALARPDEAKAIKEREEQRDKAYHDAYGMSYEEYLDFAEQEMAHLIGDMAHFDEEKYLQDYAAEITKQIDKEHGTGIEGHESAGEEPVHGTGSEVLSGEGVDDRGGSGSVEGHGEGKEEVRGGDRADAALERETSGGVEETHPIEGMLAKADNETSHHYSVASSEPSSVEHSTTEVVEHVAKVAEKTGGKVEQVNSVDEVANEKVKADIEAGKKVQGWYDEKTGKVYLYMPNIHDRYTAERVVWHETVGHKGMRGLLGDEGFKQYMKGLWYDLDNPVNAELRQYVRDRMAKDHLSMYDAIEEFIADAAEKGKGTAGFWNNVKNKVSNVLHEIGYRISPNVKDVQYMLWLAKNVQKNPNDPVWKMRAEAAKWKIEHSDMHLSEERGGEIADAGSHKSLDEMTDAEIGRETDCTVHYSTAPSTATEIDLYNRAVGNVNAMLKESCQDSMNSLTELMKVLIPGMKRVEDVRATLNPRMMENLMAGRISAKGRKFANQEMKRLDRAYVGVLDAFNGKNTEERMREASLYMIEKHGLERNRVFYVRDKIAKERESNSMFADQLQQDWNVKKKELGDKLRNGQIDLKEYYKQMDEWIRGNVDRNYIASEHDYSGMHGMQGIANLRDAYDDAGAIAHVMDCEAKMENNKNGSVSELWSATKDATNFSIHEEYSSGYLSKDRYESLRDMFDWYVPLRKYDETTMEDVYTYIHGHVGSSNSIGMTVQKAKGRKSLSDVNILAQIGAMASGALYRGGSNEVRQAFARMVGEYEKAPTDERVVTEIKGWAVKTTDSNGNVVWTEAHPPIPADDTNQETIAQEYYNWNQQMEAKKATGDAVEITGQSNIPYKFLPKGDRSQHIVSVWINGKRRDYLINGNPRAAQALNGMLNNESAKGALSAVNRFLAQSVTSWNPEFTLRNTVRDFGFASHLLEAKEGVNYWSKFEKHFFAMGLAPVGRTITAKSMADVKNGLFVNLFKRYEQGTLDYNKPYHKWFAEFMDNGGMTGIATQQRFDEWKKKVVKDVAKMREGYMRHPWTLTKDIFSTIEVANEMAENITRFATFCASRESGRTAARSAYDAHEVSVNFNTRGSGNAVKTYSYEGMGDGAKALRNATGFFTGWMRNYTMFFNASVQSFCAFSRNIKAHPVRATATLMALPFAVGALMPWVNGLMQAWCDSDEDKKKLGIPDDPYGELPEYIRRDNLCFYIGKGEFVTVPLGIETRAFYGLGDLAAGYTFHPELQSQKNVAMDVAGQLSQIVPVGDFMSGSSFGDNAKGDAVTILNKFLPSMYTPLSELVFNIDWKGQPIMRDGDYLDNSPSWMRAPRGTLTPLVNLNKKVNAETNDIMPGNENMKGDEVLDAMTNPALIEHLLDSYVGGTGTFVKRTGKVVNRAIIKAQGGNADIESKDIPFVRSLLYTPSETNAMARTKAKWYKYKEDIEKDAANMKVLKRRDVPLDEQIANYAQLQKLQNNANAQRVNIYERASKQIKRLNKRKARAQDDEESKYFEQQVNMIMEDAVKEMDAIKEK